MATLLPLQYQANSDAFFGAIKSMPYASWLDSGQPKSARGRVDIMTAYPQTRLVSHINEQHALTRISTIEGDNLKERLLNESDDCPFSLLKQALNTVQTESSDTNLPFIGGALGYWGYELGSYLMGVPTDAPNKDDLPDMAVGIYHWALVQDHEAQQAYLAFCDSCEAEIIERVKTALENIAPQTPSFTAQDIQPSETQEQYLKNVSTVLDYITAGDSYQVNYAQQFTGRFKGEPYGAYLHLREVMKSPFSAYINLGGEQAVLSFSPERFIQVSNGEVLTQPIKGTAPRSDDPAIDKTLADELLASEKNRAENVMIVDLLRNDLGKHCVAGSIKVPDLFALKSYPNVHHLVSNVIGTLRADSSNLDLLRDSFPGGSITGAPKKRSMEIIQELEQKRRGIYCGSIGYINHNGDMDTNIAIRTVSCSNGRLECWGGGGIVADSIPLDEYQETHNKVGMILRNL